MAHAVITAAAARGGCPRPIVRQARLPIAGATP